METGKKANKLNTDQVEFVRKKNKNPDQPVVGDISVELLVTGQHPNGDNIEDGSLNIVTEDWGCDRQSTHNIESIIKKGDTKRLELKMNT